MQFVRHLFPDGLVWESTIREDGVIVMRSSFHGAQSIVEQLDEIAIESSEKLRRIRSQKPELWWGNIGVSIDHHGNVIQKKRKFHKFF